MERFNLYEYTSLCDDDQYNLLFTVGDFADVKIVGNKRYVLYRVYNFYVKLTYDTENNTILDKVVFRNYCSSINGLNGKV